MRLVECTAPLSAVSVAPLTALRESHSVTRPTVSRLPDGSEVAGFWGLEDDVYYVRERSAAGDAWFRLIDDEPPAVPQPTPSRAAPLPHRTREAAAMRIAYRHDDANGPTSIMVGVYPPRSRGR
jgi:hypothetical protein